MVTKVIVRFLKKRIVLAVIFCVSLLYCLSSLLTEDSLSVETNETLGKISLPPSSFKWHLDKEKNSSGAPASCRNSVQGKVLVADDRGYVCQRSEVASNGCCIAEAASTRRYCCDTCQPNGCCSIYEYCISCCMHPQKITILQKILGKASDTFKMLVASITDHFELCLTKCRTSSDSVHHENSYRDPKAKHCYADEPPGQQMSTRSQLMKEWLIGWRAICGMLAFFFSPAFRFLSVHNLPSLLAKHIRDCLVVAGCASLCSWNGQSSVVPRRKGCGPGVLV